MQPLVHYQCLRVILVLCLLPPALRAQNSWELVSPSTPNETLESVRGTTSGLILAAGASGTILRSLDSGSTWSWSKTGISKGLYAVGISSGEKSLAVGENGTILLSSDRGATWTKRESQASGSLLTVEWLTDNVAIAGGQAGTLVKTTDGGINWSLLSSGVTWQIESMQFLNDKLGYISGSGNVSKTTDGGVTWTERSVSATYDWVITVVRFADARV